jgi:Membrane transport protein
MLNTVLGALLPINVILLMGFFSGWHKDFDGAQAAILNRVVMLCALPLLLFAGTVTVPRAVLVQDVSLALGIVGGMLGSYFVVPGGGALEVRPRSGDQQPSGVGDQRTIGAADWRVCARPFVRPAKHVDPGGQCQPDHDPRADTDLPDHGLVHMGYGLTHQRTGFKMGELMMIQLACPEPSPSVSSDTKC